MMSSDDKLDCATRDDEYDYDYPPEKTAIERSQMVKWHLRLFDKKGRVVTDTWRATENVEECLRVFLTDSNGIYHRDGCTRRRLILSRAYLTRTAPWNYYRRPSSVDAVHTRLSLYLEPLVRFVKVLRADRPSEWRTFAIPDDRYITDVLAGTSHGRLSIAGPGEYTVHRKDFPYDLLWINRPLDCSNTVGTCVIDPLILMESPRFALCPSPCRRVLCSMKEKNASPCPWHAWINAMERFIPNVISRPIYTCGIYRVIADVHVESTIAQAATDVNIVLHEGLLILGPMEWFLIVRKDRTNEKIFRFSYNGTSVVSRLDDETVRLTVRTLDDGEYGQNALLCILRLSSKDTDVFRSMRRTFLFFVQSDTDHMLHSIIQYVRNM